jgi:hypothetical protein
MTGEQLTFELVDLRRQPLFVDLAPHIVEAFWTFHKNNPQIFALFAGYARELKARGVTHYATHAIIERIRWHYDVETDDVDFKINNNHKPCYARLLATEDPAFQDFFEFRRSPGTVPPGHRKDN